MQENDSFRRRFARIAAGACALVALASTAMLAKATPPCWVIGTPSSACTRLSPGPDLDRYCGVWPLGNYCNDAVTANAVVNTVAQATAGSLSFTSMTGFVCSWNINSCALIGCAWVTPGGSGTATSDTPSGGPCPGGGPGNP